MRTGQPSITHHCHIRHRLLVDFLLTQMLPLGNAGLGTTLIPLVEFVRRVVVHKLLFVTEGGCTCI